MKRNSFFQGFGMTSLVLASTLLGNPDASIAQSNNSDKVTFQCVQIHDTASKKKIPATLVWIPERTENVRLIGWKSEHFDRTLTADQRCQIVTQKFQTQYDNGDLSYLTLGNSNGYPILCGVKNIGDPCNGDSQLFTIKRHEDPKTIQERLEDIISGQASDILLQSSGSQAYMPFADLLNSLPVYESTNGN
jgi:hypothetical protein